MNHEDGRQSEVPSGSDEGFVRRWSRLKQEARAATTPAPAAPVPVVSDSDAAPLAPESRMGGQQADGGSEPVAPAAQPLGDEDMPPLESLGPDSEVSAFFSPRVSETLRRAALHRIFHLPQFNVTDGLDDYCADYRHMMALGDVVTADMRLQMERAQERAARRLADTVRDLARDTPEAESQPAKALTGKEGESDDDV